jgi:hypothetical protein
MEVGLQHSFFLLLILLVVLEQGLLLDFNKHATVHVATGHGRLLITR